MQQRRITVRQLKKLETDRVMQTDYIPSFVPLHSMSNIRLQIVYT
jgi:hypothetical protein